MIDLSVIIPVYNASRYIAQAIDSVIAQKGVRVELIVVDDGSTDGTMEVLREYGQTVVTYTIEHSGASVARNFGLKQAHGEYVMFLDADDFIFCDTICGRCVEEARGNSLDMVMFSFRYLNNVSGKFVDAYTYHEKLMHGHDADSLFFKMTTSGVFPASPCFKVIRRKFLQDNDLFFKGRMIAEDVEWYVRLMICAMRFGLVNEAAYVYRKNVPGSATFSMNAEKCWHFLLMIKEAIKSIAFVEDLEKQKALYSCMAYEYCILMGNAYNISERKPLENELKALSWLLDYDMFPRITWARKLYHLMGYRMTAKLFGNYIRLFSKSKQ